ncbi:DUF5131 family protein [Sphingomonas sp. J344]|uniref:DUF5131 family protein n=1 Tax=unclassified Sphingomonas TaxID=196159 RepID=UPI0035AF024B
MGACAPQPFHWAILGSESGPGARPMPEAWVREIYRMCRRHDVAFFFKQWGGPKKKLTGRLLQGRTYDGMPNQPGRQLDVRVNGVLVTAVTGVRRVGVDGAVGC